MTTPIPAALESAISDYLCADLPPRESVKDRVLVLAIAATGYLVADELESVLSSIRTAWAAQDNA